MSTFNSLEFDGVNSLDHGIYITGESVYNAPERDVESLEIAGRNGDYLLDKGRWKNIDVTYNAGAFGSDQSEFATKIRQFRNLLASRYGYHRLTDTYNPNEYRLGVFKNAVEVEASSYKRAGEFDLVFNCKPQRYLTSGETELTVTSGQTINNPTLFDSSPLLAVKGYGTIEFNGYTIRLQNAQLGDIPLWDETTGTSFYFTKEKTFPTGIINNGDSITVSPFIIKGEYGVGSTGPSSELSDPTATMTHSGVDGVVTTATGKVINPHSISWSVDITFPQIQLVYGTAATYIDEEVLQYSYRIGGGSPHGGSVCLQCGIVYDGANTVTFSAVEGTSTTFSFYPVDSVIPKGPGYSTESLLGDPTYIDCDLGEVYMIKDGSYIGLNKYIDLGSDLPTLGAGNNTVTFSNTVTQLKLTPRWWIL